MDSCRIRLHRHRTRVCTTLQQAEERTVRRAHCLDERVARRLGADVRERCHLVQPLHRVRVALQLHAIRLHSRTLAPLNFTQRIAARIRTHDEDTRRPLPLQPTKHVGAACTVRLLLRLYITAQLQQVARRLASRLAGDELRVSTRAHLPEPPFNRACARALVRQRDPALVGILDDEYQRIAFEGVPVVVRRCQLPEGLVPRRIRRPPRIQHPLPPCIELRSWRERRLPRRALNADARAAIDWRREITLHPRDHSQQLVTRVSLVPLPEWPQIDPHIVRIHLEQCLKMCNRALRVTTPDALRRRRDERDAWRRQPAGRLAHVHGKLARELVVGHACQSRVHIAW